MTTRVIIVRHGQSTYNAQRLIQGRCDESVLTEQGRQDAQTVGATLADIAVDEIYHSPLQRAAQTAAIVHEYFPGVPRQASDRLLEIDLPLWEKQHKKEVATQFAEAYRCWKTRPHEFKMTLSDGREHYPVLALYEQAQAFWQEILAQHKGKTLLIVAHNGINRCLIMSAVGMSCDRYHTLQQSNCCINILNFTGGWGDSVQIESLNQTAHTGMNLPLPRPPQTQLRLLLVRHGETDWNRESRFQGSRDIPLNDNGKKQAQKAAAFLADVHLDFAISSPMLRPKETAEIILEPHDVPLYLEPEFAEIGHGLWEGKLENEIEAAFPGLLTQWQNRPETVQMPEGENLQQVWDRAIAAWQAWVAKATRTDDPQVCLVVAHDAINKVILCHLLGLQPSNFWNIKQGNGAVSVIDYPNGAAGYPVLQAINITSFLGGVLDSTAAGAL
ncbi:MAG: histidine phosphatase family protein [Jaaginema sp. PMC 1079.18]|nr:histidine phosphatase family protein [Jaaginema sp. PMC 1080.18]MEC4850591.1 histidine phosphatase family protein [Jaaginema sp. PMC 1079.18]MEC4865390.1 histidine phosphatase family protein [Jaaginema sp. PMC 1078.18]